MADDGGPAPVTRRDHIAMLNLLTAVLGVLAAVLGFLAAYQTHSKNNLEDQKNAIQAQASASLSDASNSANSAAGSISALQSENASLSSGNIDLQASLSAAQASLSSTPSAASSATSATRRVLTQSDVASSNGMKLITNADQTPPTINGMSFEAVADHVFGCSEELVSISFEFGHSVQKFEAYAGPVDRTPAGTGALFWVYGDDKVIWGPVHISVNHPSHIVLGGLQSYNQLTLKIKGTGDCLGPSTTSGFGGLWVTTSG